ncbi:MAG: SWIM zinc finger family protein [Vulcanimicrobiota bacterium]
MRETVTQKAHRLVDNFRVVLLDNQPGLVTAEVIGDHSTYTVRFRPHGAFCGCKWFQMKGHIKPCSHILATRRAMDEPESQEPVKRLAEALRANLPAKKPPVAVTETEADLQALFNFR